jgi:hypothetical protein
MIAIVIIVLFFGGVGLTTGECARTRIIGDGFVDALGVAWCSQQIGKSVGRCLQLGTLLRLHVVFLQVISQKKCPRHSKAFQGISMIVECPLVLFRIHIKNIYRWLQITIVT